MFGRFIRWLGSLFRKSAPNSENVTEPISNAGRIAYKNTYRLSLTYNKQASIYLWGTDGHGNPAFAVLYGRHAVSNRPVISSYAIFRGAGGHFPSFDRVKIATLPDHKTREKHTRMFRAKDYGYGYYFYTRDAEKKAYKDFYPLETSNRIVFNYDKRLSYADMLKRLDLSRLQLNNFELAQSPSEVMKLPAQLTQYAETLFDLFSNTNLYVRKKILKELLNLKPPKALYDYLLNVGSGELISGLFLELALRKDPIIIDEALRMNANALKWLAVSHQKGVLRCASLYADSLSDEKREEMIKSVYENAGKTGLKDINGFKNMLQKAEIYQLADALGKVAYHLDVRKYTFDARPKSKAYFNRYLRRMIDGYSYTDETKFFEAMKSFLTSFTKADDKSDQKPYLLNHYLYLDHFNKPRRFEFRPEIWDRHADEVFDILSVAEAGMIAKPLYEILLDNKQRITGMTYEKLLTMAIAPYKPAADMIVNVIGDKLKTEKGFDPDLMVQLAQCENTRVQQLAVDYFNAAGGKISSGTLVNFLFMRDLDSKAGFIEETIDKFSIDEYLEFLNSFYGNAGLLSKQSVVWPESITGVLGNSLRKLDKASAPQKTALIKRILYDLTYNELTDYHIDLSENIIFNLPFNDLKSILSECDLAVVTQYKIERIFKLLRSIKKNTVPDDAFITDVLDNGSPGTVNVLVQLLSEQTVKLQAQLGTLVILFESEVVSLNELAKNIFDGLPADAKNKLLAMVLDSPDKKTYAFGMDKLNELYENKPIPAEYIKEMLEHPSHEVRSYVSDKVNRILNGFGNGNTDLFIYYAKTLLLLPNKVSSGKKNIYNLLPGFVGIYKDKQAEIETLLLDIGGSNIISDSERALVALARIKGRDLVEC